MEFTSQEKYLLTSHCWFAKVIQNSSTSLFSSLYNPYKVVALHFLCPIFYTRAESVSSSISVR